MTAYVNDTNTTADGTDLLCQALYGRKAEPKDYLGGSNAKMLFDAARAITDRALPIAEQPVAWVIPGDDTADCNGFVAAMAYEHGEFTRPLYAKPQASAGPTLTYAPLDTAWGKINALGGTATEYDDFGRGINHAVSQALDIIEELGGQDPLKRREGAQDELSKV